MMRDVRVIPWIIGMPSITLCVLTAAAHAQDAFLKWDGAKSGDGLGSSIAVLPDVTGDRIPEVLVGDLYGDCAATSDGAALVYSGSDGSLYLSDCGTGALFGAAVATLDDVDGDGLADFLVGEPAYKSATLGDKAGRICVYSGQSGSLLYSLEGEGQGCGFGNAAAGIGDVDGDGRGDFVVGGEGYSYSSPARIGRAYVYSGASGTLIRFHEGEKDWDFFGDNVANVGDVDGDGVSDYGVKSIYDAGSSGVVYVYSGASGNSLQRWAGGSGYQLGSGLCGGLDWDQDGFGDVLAGAPTGLGLDGYLFVYSGKDGSTLTTVTSEVTGTQFGYSVSNVGDMNGDGWPEILVGEPLNSELGKFTGRATLLSGRTLRRLDHLYGSGAKNTHFGLHTAGGLDYNADGIPDMIVSEPYGSSQDPQGGRVTVFAGNDLFLQAIPNEVTAGDALSLDTRGGDNGALSILVVRDVSGTSCFLPIQIASLDTNGEMELTATVPSGFAGVTITLQSYSQKPGAKHGFVDSGLEVLSIQ